MEKFFAHFGVMPDYIWLVDKRIRGERITKYNQALNFAHKRYHAYYNAYKQRKTEYQLHYLHVYLGKMRRWYLIYRYVMRLSVLRFLSLSSRYIKRQQCL